MNKTTKFIIIVGLILVCIGIISIPSNQAYGTDSKAPLTFVIGITLLVSSVFFNEIN